MRKELLKKIKRVVIKIGSSIITDEKNVIDDKFLRELANQIKELMQKKGLEFIIVSSGAVASGMMVLKIKEKPKRLTEKQALAACGQGYLIHKYSEIFLDKGLYVAQILLTSDDISDRKRYLNAKNTLETLLEKKIIPVVNENDTIATSEIKLGDNDNLSAEVASLTEADLLIILSDVDGFYDKDPTNFNDAKVIEVVASPEKYLKKASSKSGSKVGTGGIFTKLQAARKANLVGIPVVLAKGKRERVIIDIVKGLNIGTLFLPKTVKISHKKYFLAFNIKPKGKIYVDDGARDAIVKRGKSLLPSGVYKVTGSFRTGDVVEILAKDGSAIARGLTNYSLIEVEKIKGKRSSDIEKILGYRYDDEIIHRNNMVVLSEVMGNR
ncbi:MAG: glutamate 5-kinase [Proteobacteria bacterium]|nr:glutamate 5-kinase [Pseudomonadota bacterium]